MLNTTARKEHADLTQPRVAVAFRVDHEARYLSHHDMMRLFEHAAVRAKLPLRYSQGFNPRPKLSLPLPRPTGIASRAELLVMRLAEPADPARVMDGLAATMPEGVTITACHDILAAGTVHARNASFELPVDPSRRGPLGERLEQLRHESRWVVHRDGAKRDQRDRQVDLRGLIAAITLEDGHLRFTLVADGQRWAKPSEVLALVGLDSPVARSRLVRTEVHWD